MDEKKLKKLIDKMDAEIMDWFYETVKETFGVDLVLLFVLIVQDSTELREILKENLNDL